MWLSRLPDSGRDRDGGLRNPIACHQLPDQLSFLPPSLQLGHLLYRQALLLTETHSPFLSLGYTVHLTLGTQFGLELGDGRQHMEPQTATGITGIDILIQHLQIHLLVLEFIDYLTQMQGGTGQAIQSGCHHWSWSGRRCRVWLLISRSSGITSISVRNSVGVGDSSDFPSWPIALPLIIEHHLPEKQQVIRTWPTPILASQFQAAAD